MQREGRERHGRDRSRCSRGGALSSLLRLAGWLHEPAVLEVSGSTERARLSARISQATRRSHRTSSSRSCQSSRRSGKHTPRRSRESLPTFATTSARHRVARSSSASGSSGWRRSETSSTANRVCRFPGCMIWAAAALSSAIRQRWIRCLPGCASNGVGSCSRGHGTTSASRSPTDTAPSMWWHATTACSSRSSSGRSSSTPGLSWWSGWIAVSVLVSRPARPTHLSGRPRPQIREIMAAFERGEIDRAANIGGAKGSHRTRRLLGACGADDAFASCC